MRNALTFAGECGVQGSRLRHGRPGSLNSRSVHLVTSRDMTLSRAGEGREQRGRLQASMTLGRGEHSVIGRGEACMCVEGAGGGWLFP